MMNSTQQMLVESTLPLVHFLIRTRIHINEQVQGMGYDDLFQTGCEALCHAAITYDDSHGAAFRTYAETVILHRLMEHCRKINRIQSCMTYLDAPDKDHPELCLSDHLQEPFPEDFLTDYEIFRLLNTAQKEYNGIAKKGVTALILRLGGMSNRDIAAYYHVKPNHIAAWISRAAQKLRYDPRLQDLAG